MVADSTNTYLIEFIYNEMVVTEISDKPYMTNFYLTNAEFNDDGSVIKESLTPHSMGIERYNIITDRYNTSNSVNGMTDLMRELYITNSYKDSTNPFWYSEFNGDYTSLGYGDLTTSSSLSDYEEIVQHAKSIYVNRERDGRTSQTVHSSVYDMANKKLYLTVQESNNTWAFRMPEDSISSLSEQIILNNVQKSLDYNIGSTYPQFSSLTWDEIFGAGSTEYSGSDVAIWIFRSAVYDAYMDLYASESIEPTDTARTYIEQVREMISVIKSTVDNCISEILGISIQSLRRKPWSEIIEILNSLPGDVQDMISTQIENSESALNQLVKESIDVILESLIQTYELDIEIDTDGDPESWSDSLANVSLVCSEIYQECLDAFDEILEVLEDIEEPEESDNG